MNKITSENTNIADFSYQHELDEYKHYLINILGYSKQTAITYLFYVKKLLYYHNDYKHLLKCLGSQTNNTKRVILSAIKNYYKYSKNSSYNEIILPRKDKKILNHITLEEYRKVLSNNSNNSLKTLILRILFETGIRSSEFLSIKVSDISMQSIVVKGKGNKQRMIYTSANLYGFICQYIQHKNLSGNDFLLNFDYRNLYKHIRNIGKTIDKHLTPHMFRRGFATYCIDKDIGIYDICLMLGHENINTTKMYLRNEYRIEAMKNLFD